MSKFSLIINTLDSSETDYIRRKFELYKGNNTSKEHFINILKSYNKKRKLKEVEENARKGVIPIIDIIIGNSLNSRREKITIINEQFPSNTEICNCNGIPRTVWFELKDRIITNQLDLSVDILVYLDISKHTGDVNTFNISNIIKIKHHDTEEEKEHMNKNRLQITVCNKTAEEKVELQESIGKLKNGDENYTTSSLVKDLFNLGGFFDVSSINDKDYRRELDILSEELKKRTIENKIANIISTYNIKDLISTTECVAHYALFDGKGESVYVDDIDKIIENFKDKEFIREKITRAVISSNRFRYSKIDITVAKFLALQNIPEVPVEDVVAKLKSLFSSYTPETLEVNIDLIVSEEKGFKLFGKKPLVIVGASYFCHKLHKEPMRIEMK